MIDPILTKQFCLPVAVWIGRSTYARLLRDEMWWAVLFSTLGVALITRLVVLFFSLPAGVWRHLSRFRQLPGDARALPGAELVRSAGDSYRAEERSGVGDAPLHFGGAVGVYLSRTVTDLLWEFVYFDCAHCRLMQK